MSKRQLKTLHLFSELREHGSTSLEFYWLPLHNRMQDNISYLTCTCTLIPVLNVCLSYVYTPAKSLASSSDKHFLHSESKVYVKRLAFYWFIRPNGILFLSRFFEQRCRNFISGVSLSCM